jgi:hypothetical protein
VPNSFVGKIPQALKSLYYAENELRRALFKGVVLRTEEAREHLAQARRHLTTCWARRSQNRSPPRLPRRATGRPRARKATSNKRLKRASREAQASSRSSAGHHGSIQHRFTPSPNPAGLG